MTLEPEDYHLNISNCTRTDKTMKTNNLVIVSSSLAWLSLSFLAANPAQAVSLSLTSVSISPASLAIPNPASFADTQFQFSATATNNQTFPVFVDFLSFDILEDDGLIGDDPIISFSGTEFGGFNTLLNPGSNVGISKTLIVSGSILNTNLALMEFADSAPGSFLEFEVKNQNVNGTLAAPETTSTIFASGLALGLGSLLKKTRSKIQNNRKKKN